MAATANCTQSAETCDRLAALLDYPEEGFLQSAQETVERLSQAYPRCAQDLQSFAEFLRSHSVDELQEHFTRIFDNSEKCALEIGWHLYGETYQRGVFMAQMRELLRQTGVEESSELPDHLAHVLKTHGRLARREARIQAQKAILPALDKILDGLGGRDSPYRFVLQATHTLVSTAEHSQGESR